MAKSSIPIPILSAPTNSSPGSRIARNVGWLAGARSITGLLSVFYLAVTARALEPRDFGIFILILTYGQLIVTLVQFQSWKGVIRYGARHLANGRADRLARLFGFTATLDALGMVIGAILAIGCVPLVAPLLHWPAGQQASGAIFGVVLMLATSGTPSGILRLFDRFDLLAATEALSPMIRLFGAIGVWFAEGGIWAFLAVWGAAAVVQALAQWVAVIAIHRARFTFGRSAFRRAARENRRSLRFMILTTISNSLCLFWVQLGTLSVGAVAGPAEAGGFRIADRLSKGVTKPGEIVTRALFPELARLVAARDHATLRKILLRATAIAGLLALIAVMAIGLGGKQLITLLVGQGYAVAHTFLFLLAISAAINLVGFALEPFHVAHGRAGRVLLIRLVGASVYVIMLVVLLPRIGSIGAAFASIAASGIMFVQLVISAVRILR